MGDNFLRTSCFCIVVVAVAFVSSVLHAETIDPNDNGAQYAWGNNVGWLNFEPGQGTGVTVTDKTITGYVWSENIGWINLSPASHGGVSKTIAGELSGYAWAENVGWINFDPNVPNDATHYGVTIDSEGFFDGWAYGENVGWIHLRSCVSCPVEYKVKTAQECTPEPDVSHNWVRTKISDATDNWVEPRIAVEGCSVHVVWKNTGVDKLMYRRSTDGGRTWYAAQTLATSVVYSPKGLEPSTFGSTVLFVKNENPRYFALNEGFSRS